MKLLISSVQVKVHQLKQLLETANPNSRVYHVRKWRDFVKFEIVSGGDKAFLCVSDQFFADLGEVEISKRLQCYEVARAVQLKPKGHFILTCDRLEQGSCEGI